VRSSFTNLMKNQNNLLKHKEETGVYLVERTVGLEVDEAYTELKAVLVEKNCLVTTEEAPVRISVRQGSIWGISPVSAKKNVECSLSAVEGGTRVTCSSTLASDWKNLTIIGSVLSVVVVALCLWISADLDALVTTQQQDYWSWIATVDGYVDVQTAKMFAGFTRMLGFFLAVVLAAEVAIVVFVKRKINSFAEETLNTLR
jgi:hypothetical protein